MSGTIYFVETLTVRTWLQSVWPRLIAERSRRPPGARCYVFEGSALGWRVARASWRLGGARPEPFEYRLVDVRDADGLSVRLRVAYQDWAKVQDAIMRQPLWQQVLAQARGQGRRGAFLAKRVATMDKMARATWWRALLVVQISAWKRRIEGRSMDRAVLWMESRPWMSTIIGYAAESGVEIAPYAPVRGVWQRARDLLPTAVRRWLREWSLRRGTGGVCSSSSQALTAGDGRILVESHGQLNLKRPECHSDLFFWQTSPLSGSDLLLMFNQPHDPYDAPKREELEAYGIRAVVTDPRATTLTRAPRFAPPRVRGPGPRLPASAHGLEGRWIRQELDAYHRVRAYWRELCRSQGVKIYLSWFKYNAMHCAIADALEELGGVTAMYQRAYDSHPSAETAVFLDVFFGFSRQAAEQERASGSVIPYFVTTGYLGDHRFPRLRQQAAALRWRLERQGAIRVLGLTDENSADDARWHTDHAFIRAHYAFVLERVLANPWLGLVIKPKVPATLRRRLGPVAELLRRAEATGRCVVYESGAVHGSYPPAAAALASDVVIHAHLCAGTAAMESALTGVPTLLMDGEGWAASPLYRLGPGVVFTDWEALWKACEAHWRRPGGVPGFGDWTPMLDELDPFRDGRAAERMGTYLQWLLEGFRANRPRDAVLADAAQRYGQRWGADKILPINIGNGQAPAAAQGPIEPARLDA